MKDSGQEGVLAARYRLAKFDIAIAEHEFTAAGGTFPQARGFSPHKMAWRKPCAVGD